MKKSQLGLVEVDCLSEFEGDDRPRRALVRGRWIEVEEVMSQTGQGGVSPQKAETVFYKVLGDDGSEYVLKRDRTLDLWFLESSG